jgi:hypothetical protein
MKTQGKRFIAIVGMLGSDGQGERANAAALATKMLKDWDLTWDEVIGTGNAGEKSSSNDSALKAHIVRLEETNRKNLAAIGNLRRENERLLARVTKLEAGPSGTRDYSKGEQAGPKHAYHDSSGKIKTFNFYINELIDQIENRLSMSEWEENFCMSIRQRNKLSDKQLFHLRRLAEKAGVPCDGLDE